MLGMKAAEVARALDGVLKGTGDVGLRGVVTDSRQVRPGDLFVALPGARTDGHHYLDQAQRAGAGAALVQPDRGVRPPGLDVVVVPDTLAALGELAHYHLRRVSAPVVGITGTVGKTTAKDFLAHLLGGPEAGVHAAPASYNSECGLPLAVLAATPEARILVLEYGVNAPGEMRRLLDVAAPHFAWLTAVTEVHLEGMGDLATIAREKSLLLQAVPETGVAWLPRAVAEQVRDLGGHQHSLQEVAGRLVETGFHEGGTGRVLHTKPGAWTVDLPGIGEVVLPVCARHEAEIAATAALMARELGVPADQVRARCASLKRPPGRLSHHEFEHLTVLDDSYNASPAAMRAALEVLRSWPNAGRRIAVLGTMHELGTAAEALHHEVGRSVAEQDLEILIAVGRGGAWIAEAARDAGSTAEIFHADDAVAASCQLVPRLQRDDVLLLKASRAEGLERLLAPLQQAAPGLPVRSGLLKPRTRAEVGATH